MKGLSKGRYDETFTGEDVGLVISEKIFTVFILKMYL